MDKSSDAKSKETGHRMWGGRFSRPLDPGLLAFTSSFDVDRRLLRWDVLASIAHAEMLGATGIIPAADARAIADGLRSILRDAEGGDLVIDGPFEDVHSFIDATLADRAGAAAGRLHTARSRNDQVATAFRLYLKVQIATLVELIHDLMVVTVGRATATLDVLMPGFTHYQHAQPVRLAHHLLAYAWMLSRDADRLVDCYRRTDVLPLGSGALAGVSFPIDRMRVADALGFARISENSIDATGDRDFAVETVSAAVLLMVHLSRWAEEIVVWATDEFGFVQLDDTVSTGSSLMPQKKNPDPAELIRGRAGRVIGDLTGLLSVMKGLPAGYHRDLQEDKALVFDAVDTAMASLHAMVTLLAGTQFVRSRLEAATRSGLLTATDLADYLVRKDVPFREAYELAGVVVRLALDRGVQLWELSPAEFRSVSPTFGGDVLNAVSIGSSVEAKDVPGGTSRAQVETQLQAARARLSELQTWLEQRTAVHRRMDALAGA